MQIRSVRLDDVALIVDLLEKCFAEKCFFHGCSTVDRSGLTETISRLCRRKEMRRITYRGTEIVPAEVWMGEQDGRAVACLIVAGLDNQGGIEREAYMIAVDPAFRGNAAGSALTDYFCDHYADHALYGQCYPEQQQMAEMFQRRNFIQYGKTHGGNLLFRRLPPSIPERQMGQGVALASSPQVQVAVRR